MKTEAWGKYVLKAKEVLDYIRQNPGKTTEEIYTIVGKFKRLDGTQSGLISYLQRKKMITWKKNSNGDPIWFAVNLKEINIPNNHPIHQMAEDKVEP